MDLKEGERRSNMAKSFRKLTILLGKLGIGQDKFVRDNDQINKRLFTQGFSGTLQRPPWKTGIEYGLGLAESVAWTKQYIKNQEKKD